MQFSVISIISDYQIIVTIIYVIVCMEMGRLAALEAILSDYAVFLLSGMSYAHL